MKAFFALPLVSLPAAALFVMPGLLSAVQELPLRTAPQPLQWIWSGEKSEVLGTPVAFETDFALREVPVTARIKFTAVKGGKVFVNGTEVGANGDTKRPTAVELVKNPKKGDNKIRVEAKAGGEGDGFILSMAVADAAGTRRRLDSNTSWKVVSGGGTARELQPYGSGPWGDVFASLRPSKS